MEKAFGFSLAPLVVRASELALKANQVSEETRKFRRAKEALSICRRGVRKLIMAAMEEGLIGDWVRMEAIFITIVSRIPRNTTRLDLETILEQMTMLLEETLNLLETGVKSKEFEHQ